MIGYWNINVEKATIGRHPQIHLPLHYIASPNPSLPPMTIAFVLGAALHTCPSQTTSTTSATTALTIQRPQHARCCMRAYEPTNGPTRISGASKVVRKLRLEIERITGEERGLFGTPSSEQEYLQNLLAQLESTTPNATPTKQSAVATAGKWRLLYTTVTILGRRRVKLAIGNSRKPGFVRIEDITQEIIPADNGTGCSLNIVNFKFITGGTGCFSLDARYNVVSDTRVDVKLERWRLEPRKLMDMLGSNVELLLELFNPEGYLEIGYVDDALRIGRDHNGNVFVMEKVSE